MKKKHLQFNDITAPSLARRAARRGAEKGESGRMELGVINVFFSFPCKKQRWILLILFKPLPFSSLHPFLIFCSLAHSFPVFVRVKLSIILFWRIVTPCHSSLSNIRFLDLFQLKNKKIHPGHCAFVIFLYFTPLSFPLSFVWLHQKAIVVGTITKSNCQHSELMFF